MLRCLRCDHTWTPRTPHPPARCPKCTSPAWNVPRRTGTEAECLHCEHRWRLRDPDRPPARCPKCARTSWDKPNTAGTPAHCNQCEHAWTPRIADPVECPKCHSYRWREPPRPSDPPPAEPAISDSCFIITYPEAPWPPPERFRHGHDVHEFFDGTVKPGPQSLDFCITERCEIQRLKASP